MFFSLSEQTSVSTNLTVHLASIVLLYMHSEKQSHSYGNLGSCYVMLRQYTHAIFCHNKVGFYLSDLNLMANRFFTAFGDCPVCWRQGIGMLHTVSPW